MSKKTGTSLLLALAMLISILPLNSWNGFTSEKVYAAPACPTITECINRASEARDNIAEIVSQENELSDEIAVLNGQITAVRNEIESLELSINWTQLQISELQDEINDNRALLEETEEDINELMNQVAARMTITQRMDNRNTVIALLTESVDLNDFISQVRFFSQVANSDADMVDQLADLLDLYDGLLVELNEQVEEHEKMQENLETEQANFKSRQETLATLEADLRDELYDLGIQRMTEEDALAIAESAREVLENTPPPQIVTPRSEVLSETDDSSISNNMSGATDGVSGDNVNGASNNIPSASQNAGTNSGLSHPMPGAPVTSEFGPRTLDGFHWGIDVALGGRPSILAAASGTVTVNTWHNMLGWYMIISHDINGQRVDTVYAHMESQSSVSVGTVVSQGQAIGIQGNTGFSFGAHLHFEVHPGGFAWNSGVNPREWINF